jgi:hypothetical protein
MEVNTKLTSVNIIDGLYKKFKIKSIEESINLQKVVNRSLDLYIKDEEFRNKINAHTELGNSGTKF